MHPVLKLVITFVFGMFGVHKFIEGDKKKGVLYLCTLGLFYFGWLYDVVLAAIDVVKFYKNGGVIESNPKYGDASFVTLAYKSPSGGYMNYAEFKVVGINQKTNRQNTRRYYCKDEGEAAALATQEGLVDIISVTAIPFTPPSEAQYEACRKHNRNIPYGACLSDVSALMTRDIENQKPASIELMQYADSLGLRFSYLIGEESLREMIDEMK